MKEITASADRFLRSIEMHPDCTDIGKLAEAYMSEMDRGLKGEFSSLEMIPTYIAYEGGYPDNVPVIAVDAGGTNLRIGLVIFKDGAPCLSKVSKYAMPGSHGEISAAQFFDELAEKILPLTGESSKIGFCFSYPAEILPNGDGKILCLTKKEVCVRDAEGIIIGERLAEKLREKGSSKSFKTILLNDTTASLMGGIATEKLSDCDGLAGLILGTGNNTCYTEKGENIIKLKNAKDMIVNCESGNFSKANLGLSDKYMDLNSDNPGGFLFEKMLSGVYHGKLITNTASLAAREGLLSSAFAKVLPPFTTPELDDFLRGVNNRVAQMCTGDDAEVLSFIVEESFERAAKLVCANISALMLHCDGGKSTEHQFCVVAEGSTFYNSLLFRAKLDKYVGSFVEGELSRHVVFRGGENLTLTGAALAALLN
jgi:hexokinase